MRYMPNVNMHYPKLNELSKLQGFMLVKHWTPGNCNITQFASVPTM